MSLMCILEGVEMMVKVSVTILDRETGKVDWKMRSQVGGLLVIAEDIRVDSVPRRYSVCMLLSLRI